MLRSRLEMAKSAFELRLAGSESACFAAALCSAPPPKGCCWTVPVSKLYCAVFTEHAFEKTQTTEAVVTAKPGLRDGEPPSILVGRSLSGSRGGPPVIRHTRRPSGTARNTEKPPSQCRHARSGTQGDHGAGRVQWAIAVSSPRALKRCVQGKGIWIWASTGRAAPLSGPCPRWGARGLLLLTVLQTSVFSVILTYSFNTSGKKSQKNRISRA